MGLVSWFRKILRRQAIVEELGDEENTRTGELDDKSKGTGGQIMGSAGV